MNRKKLRELSRDKNFQKFLKQKNIGHKKKSTLLVLVVLALIIYLIFTKANVYLIIGLIVLLILMMR